MKQKNILLIAGLIALSGLAVSPADALALNSGYYAGKSRLAEGRWVKIKVTESGIHQINYAQLKQWGFDNPERVGVYGFSTPLLSGHNFSTSLPDDLPTVPVRHRDGALLFYGDADVNVTVNSSRVVTSSRNGSDTAGYYFLTETTDNIDVTEADFDIMYADTVTSHVSVAFMEPEEANPLQMGAHFYSNPIDSDGRTFKFPVSNWLETGSARVNYTFVGTTRSKCSPRFELGGGVTLLGHTPGELTDNSVLSEYNRYNFSSAGVLRLSSTTDNLKEVELLVRKPATTTCTYFALDKISLVYDRSNDMGESNSMRMFFPGYSNGVTIAVGNAPSNLVVWDITNRNSVFSYKTSVSATTGDVSFVSDSNADIELMAFNPDAEFPGVEFVGEVATQNLHGADVPDMLIVTTAPLMAQAERLAELHRRHQGLDVLVVDQQQVFNEFSSGARQVDAYRRLAKMFYDREYGKLKYMLLLGTAYYDNRGLLTDVSDRLLTFQAEIPLHACNTSYCYTSDSFFGMLADNFSAERVHQAPIHVSVGRVPVSDALSAEKYIAKVADYLENPTLSGSNSRALILAGAGDSNSHLAQAESLASLISNIDPTVNVTKAYKALYKLVNKRPVILKSALAEALARGQGYMCYTGHSGANNLTDVMTSNDIPGYTFGAGPYTFLASCDTYPFDQRSEYIAKTMLLVPSGPPAVVAAGRDVYQDNNGKLSEAFASQFFGGNEGDCIGDVYRRAHNNSGALSGSATESLRRNNMCYNLAGDPALPIYRSTRSVALETINSTEVVRGDSVAGTTVSPAAPFNISGVVVDEDGNVDTDFNGEMFISLYESPRTVESLTETSGDSSPVLVTVDENLLGQYSAKVVNGKWEATLIAPEPAGAGTSNRMTFYARSTSDRIATGVESMALAIAPSRDENSDYVDNAAPVIEEMYLNSPAFTDGSMVGRNNTLVARILPDESGINFSSSIIGGSTRLMLDGNRSFSDAKGGMLYNSDGSITLTYNFSNLSEGLHTIELSVADNVGNRSSRSLAFHVLDNVNLNVVTDRRTARDEITFDIEGDVEGEFTGRIYVENAAGEIVYTRDNCSFPLEWDMRDNKGKRVDDGSYRVFATVRTPSLRASTGRTLITVISPR